MDELQDLPKGELNRRFANRVAWKRSRARLPKSGLQKKAAGVGQAVILRLVLAGRMFYATARFFVDAGDTKPAGEFAFDV